MPGRTGQRVDTSHIGHILSKLSLVYDPGVADDRSEHRGNRRQFVARQGKLRDVRFDPIPPVASPAYTDAGIALSLSPTLVPAVYVASVELIFVLEMVALVSDVHVVPVELIAVPEMVILVAVVYVASVELISVPEMVTLVSAVYVVSVELISVPEMVTLVPAVCTFYQSN